MNTKTVSENFYRKTIVEIIKIITEIDSKTEMIRNNRPIDKTEPIDASYQGGTELGLSLREIKDRLEQLNNNIA